MLGSKILRTFIKNVVKKTIVIFSFVGLFAFVDSPVLQKIYLERKMESKVMKYDLDRTTAFMFSREPDEDT